MGKHTYHLLPRQRYQMVRDYLGGHAATDICRFYGVARKTLYYWLSIWQRDPDNFTTNVAATDTTPHRQPRLTDAATTALIVRLRKKSRYGPRRLQLLLKERGVVISAHAVYNVLTRAGLVKKRRRKVKKKYQKYTAFMVQPGQKVQVDVAYLPRLFGKTHRQYVYQAIDLYTRITFSAIYPECTPQATVQFLGRTMQFFPFSVERFQFDHGSEFTYDKLVQVNKEHPVHVFLNQQGIPFCFSPVATPRMNGCIERVHQTWRQEVERWHRWKTPTAMHRDNRRWMQYYNEERPHFGLQFLAPLQKLRSVEGFKDVRLDYSV